MDKNTGLEKAKENKAIQEKYMLAPSFIKAKQLLHLLQKTPKKYVYDRPGKGGGTFTYVKGSYVKKVLNYVFGWAWDFQIVDKGREGDQIWVQGRLTIRNPKGEAAIIKEQFGRADIKYYRDRTKGIVDYGNDLKAASTDALKKCASELGIASDVYAKEEQNEVIHTVIDDTKPTETVSSKLDIIRAAKTMVDLKKLREMVINSKYNETQKNIMIRVIEEQEKTM